MKRPILRLRNKHIRFDRAAWIMGVLNATPDSFSDGGFYLERESAVEQGLELLRQGADILDIGGESSRPGSDPVSADEEMKRVIPVIRRLRNETGAPISIDTVKAEVAEAALDAGADIINDISALRADPHMGELAARKGVPVVLMHMRGTPKTMQMFPSYDDVLGEIKDFFRERMAAAADFGIAEESLILDPGIGFGKRLEDNLHLINHLDSFADLGRPILVGVSRKSFLGAILDLPVDERLEGTIAASLLSRMKGAHLIRVHDVAPVKRALQVAERILQEETLPAVGMG
ncbi:MAG: dihydropteroate synthase [Acidobacteriota bacterium]